MQSFSADVGRPGAFAGDPFAAATPLPLTRAAHPASTAGVLVGWLAAGGDAAMLLASAGLGVVVVDGLVWPSVAAGVVMLTAALVGGQYQPRITTPPLLGLVLPWLVAALTACLLIVLADEQKEAWHGFAAWAIPSAVGLAVWRLWLGRLVAAWGRRGRFLMRVAVLGSGNAGPLLGAIATQGNTAGVVLASHHANDQSPDAALLQQLGREAAAGRLDAVVVALPWTSPAAIRQTCAALCHLTADVWMVADPRSPATLAAQPGPVPEVAMLPIALRPLAGWRRIAKRAEDVVLASLLLVVLSPLLLLVAVCVALDSRGPVLLRQHRFGYGNIPFEIYKFRTMYHDRGDRTGAQATVPGDRRVTRIGRFLRRSSIDELPQLLNVLKGQMSLVGPRAHPVEMRVLGEYYYDVVPLYRARHRVKPGITGLAQINGYRGLVDTMDKASGRVAWDLDYIERWSLGLDIRILARTLLKGFFGPGAF